ncbi:MAG TPA: recombinase family protein [Candidatus Limnocylindrales bacterium]|nr:recombinase family protein [Candidatus Limnocylindrales bacterium]
MSTEHKPVVRCAIYTRKSSEEGLEQSFNSLDAHGVSFVSITQQFNTTSFMGRLTLNVLLSFAQFEREVTGERIRDKITASKRKGMWMGGVPPLGYDLRDSVLPKF